MTFIMDTPPTSSDETSSSATSVDEGQERDLIDAVDGGQSAAGAKDAGAGAGEDVMEEEGDEFDVEAIRGKELIKGKLCYNVKWVGYDKPTWEPVENCGHLALVQQYEAAQKAKKVDAVKPKADLVLKKPDAKANMAETPKRELPAKPEAKPKKARKPRQKKEKAPPAAPKKAAAAPKGRKKPATTASPTPILHRTPSLVDDETYSSATPSLTPAVEAVATATAAQKECSEDVASVLPSTDLTGGEIGVGPREGTPPSVWASYRVACDYSQVKCNETALKSLENMVPVPDGGRYRIEMGRKVETLIGVFLEPIGDDQHPRLVAMLQYDDGEVQIVPARMLQHYRPDLFYTYVESRFVMLAE